MYLSQTVFTFVFEYVFLYLHMYNVVIDDDYGDTTLEIELFDHLNVCKQVTV